MVRGAYVACVGCSDGSGAGVHDEAEILVQESQYCRHPRRRHLACPCPQSQQDLCVRVARHTMPKLAGFLVW